MRRSRFGNRLPWLTLSFRPWALRRHLSVALPFRREHFASLLAAHLVYSSPPGSQWETSTTRPLAPRMFMVRQQLVN
jgi:hypothetical protein